MFEFTWQYVVTGWAGAIGAGFLVGVVLVAITASYGGRGE